MGLDGGGEGGCAALPHRRHRTREVDLRPGHQGGGGAEGGRVGHGEARHVRLQAGESYVHGRGKYSKVCTVVQVSKIGELNSSQPPTDEMQHCFAILFHYILVLLN